MPRPRTRPLRLWIVVCTTTSYVSGFTAPFPAAPLHSTVNYMERDLDVVLARRCESTKKRGFFAMSGVDARATTQDRAGSDERREATKAALLEVFGEVPSAGGGGRSYGLSPRKRGDGQSSSAGAVNGDVNVNGRGHEKVLACPSTLDDLAQTRRLYGPGRGIEVTYKMAAGGAGMGKRNKYMFNGVYTDFVGENKLPWAMSAAERVQEGTFQSPVTAFLYERGWRESFNANGFPGIDKEFEELLALTSASRGSGLKHQVQEFFGGAEGGVVFDLSCGSGLMTRRLAASKRYSRVVGADLSPAMLTETARRFRNGGLGSPELIRCDVSMLPVKSGSVDAVHAGAALHCWTSLEEALSEIHRVLKPGGKFFATTFLNEAFIRNNRGRGFRFFTVQELNGIAEKAGFAEFEARRNGRACGILKATKALDSVTATEAEAAGAEDSSSPRVEALVEEGEVVEGEETKAGDALE